MGSHQFTVSSISDASAVDATTTPQSNNLRELATNILDDTEKLLDHFRSSIKSSLDDQAAEQGDALGALERRYAAPCCHRVAILPISLQFPHLILLFIVQMKWSLVSDCFHPNWTRQVRPMLFLIRCSRRNRRLWNLRPSRPLHIAYAQ